MQIDMLTDYCRM